MRTRVEIIVTPGPTLKIAATGEGFSSITNVIDLRVRASPGGRFARIVTGTTAASSARSGISSVIRLEPSASGRPLKTFSAISCHESLASLADDCRGKLKDITIAKAVATAARTHMPIIGVSNYGFTDLFPFQLRKGGCSVSGIIFVK